MATSQDSQQLYIKYIGKKGVGPVQFHATLHHSYYVNN